MSEARFGSKAYYKETGVNGPMMRALEVMGIIKPLRSESGWRLFSEEDIKATKAWKARQPKSKRGGRRFGE